MKKGKSQLIKIISLIVIIYAIGLKTFPQNTDADFYAPHAGQCVPELEF